MSRSQRLVIHSQVPGELLQTMAELGAASPAPQQVEWDVPEVVAEGVPAHVDRSCSKAAPEAEEDREAWLNRVERLWLAHRFAAGRAGLPGAIERLVLFLATALQARLAALDGTTGWWAFGRAMEEAQSRLGADAKPWAVLPLGSAGEFDAPHAPYDSIVEHWCSGLLHSKDDAYLRLQVKTSERVREAYRAWLGREAAHATVLAFPSGLEEDSCLSLPLVHIDQGVSALLRWRECGLEWSWPQRATQRLTWAKSLRLAGDDITGHFQCQPKLVPVTTLECARQAAILGRALEENDVPSERLRLARACATAVTSGGWYEAFARVSRWTREDAEPAEEDLELVQHVFETRVSFERHGDLLPDEFRDLAVMDAALWPVRQAVLALPEDVTTPALEDLASDGPCWWTMPLALEARAPSDAAAAAVLNWAREQRPSPDPLSAEIERLIASVTRVGGSRRVVAHADAATEGEESADPGAEADIIFRREVEVRTWQQTAPGGGALIGVRVSLKRPPTDTEHLSGDAVQLLPTAESGDDAALKPVQSFKGPALWWGTFAFSRSAFLKIRPFNLLIELPVESDSSESEN